MRPAAALMILASPFLLGACQAVAIGVAAPMVIQQKHVNLTNASYAAADTLAQQSSQRFSRERPLLVSGLQEILDMNQKKVIANPKLGRVMTGQMRDRFVQLGYNVIDEDRYRGTASGMGEVTGTYEIVHGTMTVSLKMLDRGTGRIITTYIYSLPVTYEIKKHMSGNANMLPPLL